MNRAAIQLGLILFALCGAKAQEVAPRVPLPPPPLPASPVATFRMLITTNEAGRNQWLALHKPGQREYLQSKIAEYLALSVEEREARLQALRLRWYLPQLMKMPSADRAARLAQIPEPERALLSGKLKVWDILPPPIRQDLLENQLAISVFLSAKQGGSPEGLPPGVSPERRKELEAQSKRLDELPSQRRAHAIATFERIFGLPTNEQGKALQRLTPTELAQMQQTLTRFNTPAERQQALAGFRKFAELSPEDRAAFLQTADRWQAMSEADRENWRKMVTRLRSAGAIPPLPPPNAARKGTAALAGKDE
jgi:hypothetical protein